MGGNGRQVGEKVSAGRTSLAIFSIVEELTKIRNGELASREEEGGEVTQQLLSVRGGSRHRPEVQTLTLLYTILERKGNPFRYLQ